MSCPYRPGTQAQRFMCNDRRFLYAESIQQVAPLRNEHGGDDKRERFLAGESDGEGGHCEAAAASGASDGPSSSARAALPTTSHGCASPAGRSATAKGSGTGTRCSERIRGQRAAVGAIEFERISDEIVSGLTAVTAARELRPDCGASGRHGQTAHDTRIEATKAAPRGIG